MRIIAIVVVLALVLPVVIGTVVTVKRALFDDDQGSGPTMVPRAVIPPFGAARFRVGDDPTAYCALLASTDAAHQQGMQRRSDLGGYDAMIFSFPAEQSTPFINHYVPIDLDIGWYDSRGVLVDHTTMDKCPEGQNCPTYAARDPFRYAVETPAGGLSALGLTASGATLHVGGGC